MTMVHPDHGDPRRGTRKGTEGKQNRFDRFLRGLSVRSRIVSGFLILVALAILTVPLTVANQRFVTDRLRQISEVENLHLPNHERLAGSGGKTAATPGKFCHEGGTSNDRRLFDSHRDENLASINHEVQADAERKGEDPDGIFDHCFSLIRGEPCRLQGSQLVDGKLGSLCQGM